MPSAVATLLALGMLVAAPQLNLMLERRV